MDFNIQTLEGQIDYINKDTKVAGVLRIFPPNNPERFFLLYSFEHPSKSASMSVNYLSITGNDITGFITSSRSNLNQREYAFALQKFIDGAVTLSLKINENIPYMLYEAI